MDGLPPPESIRSFGFCRDKGKPYKDSGVDLLSGKQGGRTTTRWAKLRHRPRYAGWIVLKKSLDLVMLDDEDGHDDLRLRCVA